jgi:mannose-1-phosphate guanylyltransferase/mannose-6-phosphate isomerase
MQVYAVIMCGGGGTRLWPASRPSAPKQFIPLIGDGSLLQATVERVVPLQGLAGLVLVAGVQHRALLERHLGDVQVPVTMLLEPEPRDSAPAMAAAAHWIHARDPAAVAVFLASDHHIPDAADFREALGEAVAAARKGGIVTLGVKPREASTQYGYIKPGAWAGSGAVCAVDVFREKPDAETARAYLADGYLWNSGNFVAGVSTLLNEFDTHVDGLNGAVRAALLNGSANGRAVVLGPEFRDARKISIDFAVMEKTRRAAVIPVDIAWSDLGAWDAVWQHSPKDDGGNVAADGHILVGAKDCLVRSDPGFTVAAVGVQDLAIVVHGRSVLVASKSHAQDVKAVVQKVDASASQPRAADLSARLPVVGSELRQWLFHQALPLWATVGTDHAGWGFCEAIEPHGAPSLAARRARVQARQVYSFATAGKMGWYGPWRQLVSRGLEDFCRYYLRPDGLFRTLVSASGAPLDDRPVLYDQAFALLAFASAEDIIPGLEAEALSLMSGIRANYSHGAGGFRENDKLSFQSNPHMHLLEACLAWIDRGKASVWYDMAGQVAALALDCFIDPGTGQVGEYFAADWSRAGGEAGRIIEPGHQFEWAWLLYRWYTVSGNDHALNAARRLVDCGRAGVDVHRNVAVNQIAADGGWLTGDARLWPQTERLKATLVFWGAREGGSSADELVRSAEALLPYLATKIPGLWFDKMKADGGLVHEAAPASSLYHIICAIEQLDAYLAPSSR